MLHYKLKHNDRVNHIASGHSIEKGLYLIQCGEDDGEQVRVVLDRPELEAFIGRLQKLLETDCKYWKDQ